MAWRINRERIVLLGWGRAMLLQLAHPLVAAGLAEHSRYGHDPVSYLRRVRGTVGAMLSLTFGTEAEVSKTAARIRAIHNRVQGMLAEPAGRFPAGTPYAADDPELLGWVHATLVDTMLTTYELFVGPLTRGEKDRYCRESLLMGALLGMSEGALPADVEELRAYMTARVERGDIAVSRAARQLARALLVPPFGTVLEPVLALGRWTTIGLLPSAIRAAYGFSWSHRQDQALHACARVARQVCAVTPPVLRKWPHARAV